MGIIAGIVGAISAGLNAIGVSVAGQAIIGQFLLTTLPTALELGVVYAANALLGQKPKAPKPQDLQSNFTTSQTNRYYMSGEGRLGGIVSFAEARDGKLYKQVAHCDAEITQELGLYLDNILVSLDGSGGVLTDQFYEDDEDPFFHLYRRPGTVNQPAQSELTRNFAEWTPAAVGAGVCDTLLTIRDMNTKHRARYYVFRGVLGLGEPDITRVGFYGRYYDPRNDSSRGGSGSERADDPSTWGPSKGNLALLIAQHRMDRERFAMDPADINWDNIAAQADICDELITDRYGNQIKRYNGAVLIEKGSETNIDAETRLLAACDGTRFEDEQGRFGIHVGKYYEPTVVLTDDDIFDIASQDTNSGETVYTHFYGLYTERDFGYKQSSTAVYVNTDVWREGVEVKSTNVPLDILLDHNTGVRVVKATAKRASARRILTVTAGLRARRLRGERFVRLNLSDAALSGVYEVASLAPQDDGLAIQLQLNTTDSGNWTLLPGEEGERPNLNINVAYDKTITNIANGDMHIVSQTVSGAGVRLVATFPVPARADYIVEIQYRKSGETIWEEYSVRTQDGAGTSGPVDVGANYENRWRVNTLSGGASDWSDTRTVNASGDTTPPLLVVIGAPTVDVSTVTLPWTNPNDSRFDAAIVYRSATTDFADATQVGAPHYGSPNQSMSTADTPGSGTWSYFVVSQSATGAQSDPAGPVTVTVS